MKNPIALVGMLECGCTYRAIRGRRLGSFDLIERCPEHDPDPRPAPARTTLRPATRSLPGSAFYRQASQ